MNNSPLIATLIASPANPVLTIQVTEKAAAAASAGAPDMLADGIAADIMLPAETDAGQASAAVRDALGDLPVDIAIQEAASRRKRVLIADMDSTMIDQECIDELAAEVGLKEKVSEITARAMNGEIAFEPALRERVALLRGLPEGIVDEIIAKRITLAAGGRTLLTTMKANGGHTILVSGGFTVFTSRIAAMLGFDENHANILEVEDGRLSGTVREPILGKQAKVDTLQRVSAAMSIPASDFIAVGDGANDLAMLAEAGAGVALHAKPSVAAQAKIRIDHGDLTALLYLQGYRAAEFVTP